MVGSVAGLLTKGGRLPVVTGCATSRGDHPADIVIDASGRASALLSWLRDAGIRLSAEPVESCGILYFGRYYRLRQFSRR